MVVKSQTKFKTIYLFNKLKPLLSAGVLYFFIISLSFSCISFVVPGSKKNTNITKEFYQEMELKDFTDQLASFREPFLNTPGIKVVNLPITSKKYIQGLADEIVGKNEIFFRKLKSANVTIINSSFPLHFSLPKGEIFLSSALVSKYLKHESMLVCILAYELVRSEKVLYPKSTMIPVGYFSMEKMLSLGRLTLDEKMSIHKWAHYITRRSGFDGEYYLSWLQIQNRNTADFIMQVGDADLINREEFLFKAFLIKSVKKVDEVEVKRNSTKTFYSFINSIRDQNL